MRKTKMIKKIGIMCLALIIGSSSLFAGCGYTKEERQRIASYRKVGKANAINYIEQKYGFTPKVKSVDNIYDGDTSVPTLTPMPSYKVSVGMEYDGREFTVEIPGDEESIYGEDDYQRDEIIDYLKEYILDACPQAEDVVLPLRERDTDLFGPYFTGDNFDDYINASDYRSKIILKLCNTDINEFSLDDFISKVQFQELFVINYKDKDKMPTPEHSTSVSLYQFKDISPYINQVVEFYKTKDSINNDSCDIYHVDYDNLLITTEQDEEVTMEKLETEDSAEYGKCLGAYHLQTNAKDVNVYIPKSLFKDNEEITVIVGESSDELIYENDEYYCFDNISILEDSEDFVSTFEFRIYAKEIKERK